jgi:chorismate mutase
MNCGSEQMSQTPKYFIVDAQVLPEIFIKVARAKQALELHEAATVNDAARLAGISRSAFYKYKDAVRPFNDMMHGRIVTLQILLRDEPGALSAIVNIFAASGANILTIHQTIPTNGVAAVTVTAETSAVSGAPEELASSLQQQRGVIKLEILAGQ